MTSLRQLLFPASPRQFRGQRWVNVGLRSAHLVGIAGIGGGFLFNLEPSVWETYWLITLTSGLGLSLVYLWSTATWILQLKGLAVVVKTALLLLAFAIPTGHSELFVLVILISSVVAHAPGRVRGYQWLKLAATSAPR
ncbi:MAG: hypothetical protein LJE70_21010 [Chromatiaceae bacterium]|nr:hypothetical protein [Chromatiaceae bacterium]